MTAATVPAAYVGLWQRVELTTADGGLDRDSLVFWLQSDSLHIDIRLPADLRVPPMAGPDAPTLEASLELARQAGFAGVTEVQGQRCHWRREIDYQAPTGEADIGLMSFNGADEIVEQGLHGRYREIWQRVPAASGPVAAYRWQSCDAEGRPRTRFLARAGEFAMLARGRALSLDARATLEERLRRTDAAGRAALLDMEIALLRRQRDRWYVLLSTLPGQEGLDRSEEMRWPPL